MVVNEPPGPEGVEGTRPPTPAELLPPPTVVRKHLGFEGGEGTIPLTTADPHPPPSVGFNPRELQVGEAETQGEVVISPPPAVAQEVASPPKAPLRSDYNTQEDYEKATEGFFNFEIKFEPTPQKERVVEIIDQISGFEYYMARRSALEYERRGTKEVTIEDIWYFLKPRGTYFRYYETPIAKYVGLPLWSHSAQLNLLLSILERYIEPTTVVHANGKLITIDEYVKVLL